LGVTTTNGLQPLLPPVAVPITQVGHWRGVSCGSRLQMVFKSSYHLQPCRLPKLGAGAALVGVTATNGFQVFLSPTAVLVTQDGCWRGVSWKSRLQIAFRSSYRLQPCRLPKLGPGGTLIGGYDYKWPSGLLITCIRARYPSWAL